MLCRSMHPSSVALVPILGPVLVILGTLSGLASSNRQEQGPGHSIANTAPPLPPQQHAAWTAPRTRLPESVVTATEALFQAGVADPRGCEYREVVVDFDPNRPEADRKASPFEVTTHGWVLPANDDPKTRRFAVCWNGLVMPLARVGEKADLAADVRSVVQKKVGDRKKAQHEHQPYYDSFGSSSSISAQGVRWESPQPIWLVLLLRLGEAELAESFWSGMTLWSPDGAPETELRTLATADPYPTIATEWAWQLMQQAADAHARADDRLALDTCLQLQQFEAEFQKTAPERARLYPQRSSNSLSPPLAFLKPLGALLADQQRRAKETRRPPASDPRTESQADRIDRLILELDDAQRRPGSHMVGMPGVLGTGPDPALVREGESAVPALLDCLVFDDRLTRTVTFDLSHNDRYVAIGTVSQRAFETLVVILGTREFKAGSAAAQTGRPARQALAAEMRTFWNRTRGKTPQDRYFDTLADDQASAEQWLDASARLIRPSDIRGTRASYATPPRNTGVVPPLYGEPLRTRTHPSLTELLAVRAMNLDPGQTIPLPGNGSPPNDGVYQANRLALDLGRWDPAGAIPTLRRRFHRSAQLVIAQEGQPQRFDRLELDLAALTLQRHDAGDPDALSDYSNWIITLTPTGWGFFPVSLFEPMWLFSDDPAMAGAAQALFENARSPWVPLFRPGQGGWSELGQRDDLICSPLLGVEAFRTLILKGLTDDRETSIIEVTAEGKVEIQVSPEWMTRPIPFPGDPLLPRGTKARLRMKDLYAWKLAQVAGFPRIELYWPVADRDAAVAACRSKLDQYAAALTRSARLRPPGHELPDEFRHDRARLAFEPLTRPATKADVESGRALFALNAEPDASVRVISLPAYPLQAEWVGARIGPRWSSSSDGSGASRDVVEFNLRGEVWQAEEVEGSAGRKRYFGFVGSGTTTQVPAEEIKLPAEFNTGWLPVGPRLEARIRAAGSVPVGYPQVEVGRKLPLTLEFRNDRGLDAMAPSQLGRSDDRATLAQGLTISLTQQSDSQGSESFPQKPIAAKPLARVATDALVPLGPGACQTALEIDLNAFFPVDEPGSYFVEIQFHGMPAETGIPDGAAVDTHLNVGPRRE